MNTYTTHSDELLVTLLSGDADKQAFTELYNRYWEKLLIQAVTKLKNEEDAKEVLQVTFMNLWRRRVSLKIRHSFHTYIASAVKYEILEKIVQQKARTSKEQKAVDLSPAEDNHTANWVDYETTRQRLEKTIQQLPEKCRLVFRISREKGLTEKQIAGELNISTKTVEAHIGKALKVLRTSLQNLFSFLF